MPDDKNHYAVHKSDMTCDCVTEPWNTHSIVQFSGHGADACDGLRTLYQLNSIYQ